MSQKTILMVEDDEFIRELYVRQLKLAGFTVENTGSGKEGVELLDKNHYDLLMLDLNIPDMSGFQILEHLKQNPQQGLQVLVLSNVGNDTFQAKAQSYNVAAYIIKSTYTPERVVEEVKSLLS